MIELKPISILDDRATVAACIEMDFLPEQNGFVADNSISLAEAYDANKAYAQKGEGDIAVPYAAYENGIMVGFAMYGYFPPGDADDDEAYCTKEPHYYFWRLLVDKNHQRRGIGREIVRQVMDTIKAHPNGPAAYCYVSYEPNNIGSKTTFAHYGFEEDGRVIDGEVVARYAL